MKRLSTRSKSVSPTDLTSNKTPDKFDCLAYTSDIIYEKYRQKNLEGDLRIKLIFLISCLLSVGSIIVICMLQYDAYFAYINQRFDYIENMAVFCEESKFYNIDLISTPIAAALLLLYIAIYRRRVFLVKKFKFRNIGVPMIVSCWNKVTLYKTVIHLNFRKNLLFFKNRRKNNLAIVTYSSLSLELSHEFVLNTQT